MYVQVAMTFKGILTYNSRLWRSLLQRSKV